MKDIKLEDVLPIDSNQYYINFISTPDAKYNYLIAKGHGDVSVGPWAACVAQAGTFERVCCFSTNLSNNALVKKLTGSVSLKVTETQRYYFSSEGDLHVESTMEFGGSSLAENFSSSIAWTIHTLPFSSSSSPSSSNSNSSEIKCSVKTEYKGYMFKGLIEKYVHQAACDSFHNWLKAVREKISLLNQMQEYDQHVPDSSSSSSASPDEDDDDDDVFYDPLETSPTSLSLSQQKSSSPSTYTSSPPSSSSSFNHYSNHPPPPSLSSSRPPPPLTATLPVASHSSPSFLNPTSPNHVIFTTYNAGRPASRAISPPTNSSLSSSANSLSPPLPSSFTPMTQPYAPNVRGWESAGESDRKELEEYRHKFALLVTQTREREKEVDNRIARMIQRMDAQTRRTRWFLVAITLFSLFWPSVAKAIVKFLKWIAPLLRQRMLRK